jgi:branched-chain amino acid transport system permease protein
MTGLAEGLAIRTTQALTVVTAMIVVALLFWFLNRTRTGKAMRAYSDNEDLALLSGINPERVVAITWLIVAALATIAGCSTASTRASSPSPISSCCCRSSPRPSSAGWATRSARSLGGFIIAFSEVA